MSADLLDLAMLFGVLLVGIALFMAFGAAGVVGYAGAILITLSVIAARTTATRRANARKEE